MEVQKKQDKEIIEKYKADIMSGRTFALHAASARSEIGYRPPMNRAQWSKCMEVIARMAAQSDSLAAVARTIIGRVNLYGTPGQAAASLYTAAGEALREGYRDVINMASPEPGRYSDNEREYTFLERVSLMLWIEMACRPLGSNFSGIGWCLSAIADDANIRRPTER